MKREPTAKGKALLFYILLFIIINKVFTNVNKNKILVNNGNRAGEPYLKYLMPDSKE